MEVLDMARELIMIHQDLTRRLKVIEKYYIYDFDQTWGSTALGFPGFGGSAMTTARTYVLIPHSNDKIAYVYFGGVFAYSCEINYEFENDLAKQDMASVMESGRYGKLDSKRT